MKNRTACFTGHRKMPPEQIDTIARRLKVEIEDLIEAGYQYFCAGGALGFDTLAARTVLNLKTTHPEIKLMLVLPCVSQADSWSCEDKKLYGHIKAHADKVVYTSYDYTRGCMHKRNRYLVDNSSARICYLTESTGGTAYTVKYAQSQNLTVINIAEK